MHLQSCLAKRNHWSVAREQALRRLLAATVQLLDTCLVKKNIIWANNNFCIRRGEALRLGRHGQPWLCPHRAVLVFSCVTPAWGGKKRRTEAELLGCHEFPVRSASKAFQTVS
jgi:hypothetical protein